MRTTDIIIAMRLYSPADEAALAADVPRMMQEAEHMKRSFVAPTDGQRREVSWCIFDFVRSRGRKVYGGHALNDALIEASPGDAFYAPNGVADIEFYSPDPVADVVELCDRLLAAGHRFVQGKEAMHHGTFTVSVEFTRVCDVSYFPKPAFDRVPVRSRHAMPGIQPILFVDPTFALIDHLKILCDPFTSHWKLDRQMPRLLALQRHFPVLAAPAPTAGSKRPVVAQSEAHVIALSAAVRWAADAGTVATVADHARAFFTLAAATAEGRPADPPPPVVGQLTLVSVNYEADLESLLAALVRAAADDDAAAYGGAAVIDGAPPEGDVVLPEVDGAPPEGEGVPEAERRAVADIDVRVLEHYPLVDMLGRRAVFRANGTVIVTLIDAHGKAVPVCAQTADGLFVAALPYTVMTSLALRFAATTDGNGAAVAVHSAIVVDVLGARARGLAAAGTTVTDPTSPFRDVQLAFIGMPRSDMSMHMAAADERRLRAGPHAQVWFTYDPSRTPPGGGANGGGKGARGGRGIRGGGGRRGGGGGGNAASRSARYTLLRCDGRVIASMGDSVLAQRSADAALAAKLDSMAVIA